MMKCDHCPASGAHTRGSIEVTPHGGGAEHGTGNGGRLGGTVKALGLGLGSEHRVLGMERKHKIRSQSKAQIGKWAQCLCGGGGMRAAAVASSWVAGSIEDRLVSYVQRWAWGRDILLKTPPYHSDIIS